MYVDVRMCMLVPGQRREAGRSCSVWDRGCKEGNEERSKRRKEIPEEIGNDTPFRVWQCDGTWTWGGDGPLCNRESRRRALLGGSETGRRTGGGGHQWESRLWRQRPCEGYLQCAGNPGQCGWTGEYSGWRACPVSGGAWYCDRRCKCMWGAVWPGCREWYPCGGIWLGERLSGVDGDGIDR